MLIKCAYAHIVPEIWATPDKIHFMAIACVIVYEKFRGHIFLVAMWQCIRHSYTGTSISCPNGHLFTTHIMQCLFQGHIIKAI